MFTNLAPSSQTRYRNDPVFRDELLIKRRIEYALNREKKIALVQSWRKANPDRCKAHADKRKGAKSLLNGAKQRAKRFGLPFNIELDDIVIPTHCPALGITLQYGIGKMHFASPTLDRIIPELGYVKGNVAVISLKANTIKNNATPEEIKKVATWLLGLTGRCNTVRNKLTACQSVVVTDRATIDFKVRP